MHLQDLEVCNFKGFAGVQKIKFNIPDGSVLGSGLNILVGENNSGKSTIFEAIHFLRNGSKKPSSVLLCQSSKNNTTESDGYIEANFVGRIGEISEVYAPKKAKNFKDHLQINSDIECLRVRRKINESGQIYLFNHKNQNFDNPSGIDAPFKALFDLNSIWADTNPLEEAKFGSSSLCGSLLKAIAKGYDKSSEFQQLLSQFDEVFNNESSELRLKMEEIQNQINSYFHQQFSGLNLQFSFGAPDTDVFFKNISITVEDEQKVTPMEEEGMGLQRAIALSLLQVYADTVSSQQGYECNKPFILFIDEPELCLHPLGQRKLAQSLLKISKKQQVFIATHSPFFLQGEVLYQSALLICKKETATNTIVRFDEKKEKLFPWSPSWGEICYKAYNLPTVEFHNELYGYLQSQRNLVYETDVDNHLTKEHSLQKCKKWKKQKGNKISESSVTLPVFVRNHIHHPENPNTRDCPLTSEDLLESTKILFNIVSGDDAYRGKK